MTTFLLYSLTEDGHEVLEHESPTFDLAQKESEGYFCATRIYARVPLTEQGARKRGDS